MWLTVKQYSKKHNITEQATRKRIKAGHISESRLRLNDAGYREIKERED